MTDPSDTKGLERRAYLSLAVLIAVMGATLFAVAGTTAYWQGWVFLAVYGTASVVMTVYLAKRDPALLARRMRGGPFAEKEPAQKVIMTLTSLGFIAGLVVPALDRRFGWSDVPAWCAIAGDVLMLLGWAAILAVFKVNSFTASTIEIAPDQKVISSGPYAVVRHPMYASALPLLVGIPVALGSWWGIVPIVAILPALIWRLIDEEHFLVRNLDGYDAYRQKVQWRLIPGLW